MTLSILLQRMWEQGKTPSKAPAGMGSREGQEGHHLPLQRGSHLPPGCRAEQGGLGSPLQPRGWEQGVPGC